MPRARSRRWNSHLGVRCSRVCPPAKPAESQVRRKTWRGRRAKRDRGRSRSPFQAAVSTVREDLSLEPHPKGLRGCGERSGGEGKRHSAEGALQVAATADVVGLKIRRIRDASVFWAGAMVFVRYLGFHRDSDRSARSWGPILPSKDSGVGP